MTQLKSFFSFSHRKLSFYLELAAAILAFLGGLIFFLLDKTMFAGKTNFTDTTTITFLLLLVGSLVGAFAAFSEIYWINFPSTLLYAAGVGNQLYLSCFPWADYYKKVPFFVSDQIPVMTVLSLFVVFLVVFLLATLLSTISMFIFAQREKASV
jgi:hypothetical protein